MGPGFESSQAACVHQLLPAGGDRGGGGIHRPCDFPYAFALQEEFACNLPSDGQSPLTHNMVTLNTVVIWHTTPNLTWTFCCMADPAAWEGVFTYINFCRVAEADFEVGGRRYGSFAHDWRAEPLSVWSQILNGRELGLDYKPQLASQPASAPLLVLSQPEFADAVRQALRDYTRPDALARNPLLRSRVLRDVAGPHPGPEALQSRAIPWPWSWPPPGPAPCPAP